MVLHNYSITFPREWNILFLRLCVLIARPICLIGLCLWRCFRKADSSVLGSVRHRHTDTLVCGRIARWVRIPGSRQQLYGLLILSKPVSSVNISCVVQTVDNLFFWWRLLISFFEEFIASSLAFLGRCCLAWLYASWAVSVHNRSGSVLLHNQLCSDRPMQSLLLIRFAPDWLFLQMAEHFCFLLETEVTSIGLIMVLRHKREAVPNILRNDSAHSNWVVSVSSLISGNVLLSARRQRTWSLRSIPLSLFCLCAAIPFETMTIAPVSCILLSYRDIHWALMGDIITAQRHQSLVRLKYIILHGILNK